MTAEHSKEILVATSNEGKVLEIRKILGGLGLRILSLDDFSGAPGVEEDGSSFRENALKKARFYSKLFGKVTVSDDSGLEVDVLGGLPGITSARYSGKGATDRSNIDKLLREMENIGASKRRARFTCSIAIVSPDGNEDVIEGVCRGRIGFAPKGKRGFGYDPVFYPSRFRKTMAELTLEEKNRISHRGKALKKLKKIIPAFVV